MPKPAILYISCDFPPDASPGAIRNAAFVRHLRKAGFDIAVLRELHEPVGRTPTWEFVSELTASSAERRVLRSRRKVSPVRRRIVLGTTRLDISYPSIPNLVSTALARHKKQPFDLIYASCNPLSAAVAGMLLKQELGIPLVTELRDPWLDNPIREWPTRLHYLWERSLANRTLPACDQIVMNTPTARTNLLKRYDGRISPNQVHVIPHSFDSGRIKAGGCNGNRTGCITIGYSGGFYANSTPRSRKFFQEAIAYSPYGGDCVDRRLSSPRPLLEAYKQIISQDDSYQSRLRLRFLDSFKPDDIQFAKQIGIWEHLVVEPRRPPDEISSFLNSCDALYLTNPVFRQLRSPFISTKTVEYIATGKPIVTFLSDSDNRKVAERSGLARLVEPLTVDALAQSLVDLVGDIEKGFTPTPDWDYIHRFERGCHALTLAELFKQTLNCQPIQSVSPDCFPFKSAA